MNECVEEIDNCNDKFIVAKMMYNCHIQRITKSRRAKNG